jgi:hypothetical protein
MYQWFKHQFNQTVPADGQKNQKQQFLLNLAMRRPKINWLAVIKYFGFRLNVIPKH